MKNAYSFLRWSTKGQNKENRDSRKRQTESAEKWINEHGNGEYQLAKEVFVADGQSAFKAKHISKEKDAQGRAKGELRRFMDLVADGTISKDSILLIDSYDRFSRLDVTQSWNLFSEFLGSGIGLVFTGSHEKRVITSQLLTREPHILYFILGEMIRSNTESAEKSRKILSSQATKKIKMQAGEVLKHHCAPKYYSYNKDTKAYERNELTRIVEFIISNYLDGKSLYEISNKLNADKVRSLRYANKQANWSRMAIKSLLESKCLYGEFLGIPNYFAKPVIDKPKWDKIQMLLARNSANKGKYSSDFINIFRGLAICSHCGRHMATGCQKMNYKAGKLKEKPYRYLRCSSRANGLPCEHHSNLNLFDVERSFFADFLAKNPIDLINGDDKKEIKAIDAEIIDKQTRLNKVSEKVTALGALAGVISTADLLKQGQELKTEQETLQHDIDTLNARRSSIMAAPISRDLFNDLFIKTIEFDGDGVGKDKETVEYLKYSDSVIEKNLLDNNTRLQLRTNLPNLISKIVFDTTEKTYRVFNRSGNEVFKSERLDENEMSGKVLKYISTKSEREKTLNMKGKGELQAYLNELKAMFRAKDLKRQAQKRDTINETLKNKKRKSLPKESK